MNKNLYSQTKNLPSQHKHADPQTRNISSWTKVLSKQRQMYYWFDKTTGQTQWEDEPPLNESDYIDHFMSWVCGVILTMYMKSDQTFCTVGTLLPLLRRSLLDVFKNLSLPEHSLHASVHDEKLPTPSDVLFQSIHHTTQDHIHNIDHMFIPFSMHEHFESDFTVRTLFKFLYMAVKSGGVVWGFTINPDFLLNIKTGTDPYHRLWKNSHAKYKSQQKLTWANDTHAISLGPTSDFIWRYTQTNKSRGWILPTSEFKRYCSEYKFEILHYSSVVDFYYKYANDFMAEFKHLVGYKLTHTSDWHSMFMYDVFILRRN